MPTLREAKDTDAIVTSALSARRPERTGLPILLPRQSAILLLRICAALALIGAITLVLIRCVPINAPTVGFLYLVAVLLIATKGGIAESTAASIAAMLCFNFFFLPPVGALTIADPQNWVALFAFLATSLTASQLSAREKRRALEAEAGKNEIERLYALSRALLLTDPAQPIATQIVQHIAQTCACPAVALYVADGVETCMAGFSGCGMEAKLRESAARSAQLRDLEHAAIITPVRLGGEPIGSIAVCAGIFSDAALNSLLNLVAIALERAASQRAVTRAEVARQSEELKSTMLDAIAHEFKTPLTSIKAVTTDLLSSSPSELNPHHQELITIVDESADRLARLVTDAIQLARIEGGTFGLNLGDYFPGSLVTSALRRMKSQTQERQIALSVPDDLPMVRVDSDLIRLVITHVLDNALKYSPPDRPIGISGRLADGKVLLEIEDHGEGLPEDEQAHVFEKFYRSKNRQHIQGTGLGLSIAREIMRAHGEDIWLSSNPGKGSHFFLSLPIARESFAA
ncbi:MAG TPA: ATP-binding protein [Terracidiphilus sp.]